MEMGRKDLGLGRYGVEGEEVPETVERGAIVVVRGGEGGGEGEVVAEGEGSSRLLRSCRRVRRT